MLNKIYIYSVWHFLEVILLGCLSFCLQICLLWQWSVSNISQRGGWFLWGGHRVPPLQSRVGQLGCTPCAVRWHWNGQNPVLLWWHQEPSWKQLQPVHLCWSQLSSSRWMQGRFYTYRYRDMYIAIFVICILVLTSTCIYEFTFTKNAKCIYVYLLNECTYLCIYLFVGYLNGVAVFVLPIYNDGAYLLKISGE